MTRFLARLICYLSGHSTLLLHRDGTRLCLRCIDCGRETTGWQIGKAPR